MHADAAYKITPINFKSGMALDYQMTFTFSDSHNKSTIAAVSAALFTENNSGTNHGGLRTLYVLLRFGIKNVR